MQGSLLCKNFTKSHQSELQFSHICAARKVCKHFVRLLCCTTAGKGRKWMRLEVVKKKNPNFLYLYGRGAQRVYTSESQGILFQLCVEFARKFGKPFTGKMFDWTI